MLKTENSVELTWHPANIQKAKTGNVKVKIKQNKDHYTVL